LGSAVRAACGLERNRAEAIWALLCGGRRDLEVLRQDYVRTARAKGLAERVVVLRHMLKNALIPVVTILGPALAALVTGSFIIETIFSFPGMGRAFVQSIGQRDYSMIMGTTLIYALLVAVANLSVDIIYVFIDPRIRLEE